MWRSDTLPLETSLPRPAGAWWCRAGVCRLSPPLAHPGPHPRESAPLLRHSKTHKSLPGCPNKGLESSAGTEPLSLRRPDKRDRGSESARSDRLVHHAPWPRACSSEGSSSAPAPSPPLLPLSAVLLAGRSTTQPSGIISRRNLL